MTSVLALDLSKASTGFALWDGRSGIPRYGHWQLGSQYTPPGRVFCKLHEYMSEIYSFERFEHLVFEQPINPAQLTGHTNIDSLRLLSGLAAHAQSFGDAMALRTVKDVNISSWRKDFIGKQKRGTKRATLKSLTMERCRQLGLSPRNDDEADAIGILDYWIGLNGITPPWREDEVLRPPLGVPA